MSATSNCGRLGALALRLRDPDARARRLAVLDLAGCADERAAGPLLLVAMLDPDPAVRAQAAGVADELPAERLAESVIRALTSADDFARRAAARALAALGEPAAGSTLLLALESVSDPLVIAAILRVLRSLGHRPAARAALVLMLHESPLVRHEAVGLLGQLRRPESMDELARTALVDSAAGVRRRAVTALMGSHRHAVALTLELTLIDPDWQVRAESARVIGQLEVSSAISALITACDDVDWRVRERAVEALGRLGARRALPAIGRCVTAQIGNLRRAAVVAIGEIGDPEGGSYLEPALQDADPDVRKLGRWVLHRLLGPP